MLSSPLLYPPPPLHIRCHFRCRCCATIVAFNLRSAAAPARASTNKAPSPALPLSSTHAKSTHPRDKASNFIVISFVRSLMMYCCIAGRRERAPIEDPRRYAGGRYCTPVRRISKKAGACNGPPYRILAMAAFRCQDDTRNTCKSV